MHGEASLVPEPSITANAGKIPTQNDVRWTSGKLQR